MKECRVSHSVWRESNKWFPSIREMLGSKGSLGTSVCAWRHIGRFLECERGRSSSIKKYYLEPHHPSVSLMDVQKDFGENERDKDNQHGVGLTLLGFDCEAANRPHSPKINRRCCEATSGSRDIVSGCTSPCWLSLWDRRFQETRSISYPGLP
jgi:hypothetical protein